MISKSHRNVDVAKAAKRKIKCVAKKTVMSKNAHVVLLELCSQLDVSEKPEGYEHLYPGDEEILIAQSDDEDDCYGSELSDGDIFEALIFYVPTPGSPYETTSLHEVVIIGT